MPKISIKSILLIATFATAAQANAASFNCRYAKSPVEVAICQDEDLQALDERMAKYYFTLLNLLPRGERATFKRSQSKFIARRNACGYNADCIGSVYETRINRICGIAVDNDLDCDEFDD